MLLPPPAAPPGWYADPYGLGRQRWWDGGGWTEHSGAPSWCPDPYVPGGLRWWDGYQWTGQALAPPEVVELPRTFPIRVAVIMYVILIACLVIERNLRFGLSAELTLSGAIGLMTSRVILAYGPAVAFGIYASHRWGQHGSVDSLGARFHIKDLGWGPVVWMSMLTGQIFLAIFITATKIPLTSNVPRVTDRTPEVASSFFFLSAFVGVIIAPLAEELIFRGVMMPAFRSRMGMVAAAITQGTLFGLVHLQPHFGTGNIGLVLLLSWAGTALGMASGWLKRIWSGIFAHAIMNGVVFFLLYGQLYWHWKLTR